MWLWNGSIVCECFHDSVSVFEAAISIFVHELADDLLILKAVAFVISTSFS